MPLSTLCSRPTVICLSFIHPTLWPGYYVLWGNILRKESDTGFRSQKRRNTIRRCRWKEGGSTEVTGKENGGGTLNTRHVLASHVRWERSKRFQQTLHTTWHRDGPDESEGDSASLVIRKTWVTTTVREHFTRSLEWLDPETTLQVLVWICSHWTSCILRVEWKVGANTWEDSMADSYKEAALTIWPVIRLWIFMQKKWKRMSTQRLKRGWF